MFQHIGIILAAGFAMDMLFGDPHWLPHPVRWMGHMITWLENVVHKLAGNRPAARLVGGGLLVLLVAGFWTLLPLAVLWAAFSINIWLGISVHAVMCYQMLAAKSLRQESMKVYKALLGGTLEEARYSVSMIVGRDTALLDREGVTKAAVETVAENASDGVIAPMFFMAIGGAPLGYFYKAVNTMDSMIGYKNEKYLYLGRFAARLDDLLNLIPSRISAWLMIMASSILGFDWKNAIRIYLRDRHNHASPNSAQTEAACAGALGVRLAGDAYYFGKLYKKPFIGDALRSPEAEDIKRANRIMLGAACLMLVIVLILRFIITGI